jgi:antitoxin VapB
VPLYIKNPHVGKLVDDLVQLTGETKTEAVRKALEERLQRLTMTTSERRDAERLFTFLREEVWPQIPEGQLGKRLSKEEEEQITGSTY